MKIRVAFFLCFTAVAAAQPRIEQNRASLQLSAVMTSTQLNLSTNDEAKTKAREAFAEGTKAWAAGKQGEVRRALAKARTALNGKAWDASEEFVSSLVLRTPSAVIDPSRPLIGQVSQVYPASIDAKQGMRMRVALHESEGTGRLAKVGKLVRDFGIFDGVSPDLIDEPFIFDADLSGIEDGNYFLIAVPMDFYTELAEIATRVTVVKDLDATRRDVEMRLKKIQGHDSTKATIRAPFDAVRRANLGQLDVSTAGLSGRIAKSRDLLATLESGKDPLYQAKGDLYRHYYFATADEIMPYRVYVPSKYDGKSSLPLVVTLHGLGGDENGPMDRDGKLMVQMAEKHGFIAVSPLGFRSNGAYGNNLGLGASPAQRRIVELSEEDTLNVISLVEKEYKTDPKRTFLMGHSMGGGGTWYLGQKLAPKWKAIAPIAAPPVMLQNYPWDKMKNTAIFVAHGDKDPTVNVSASRGMVEKAKAAGAQIEYLEVPGSNHNDIVPAAVPKIFEFFAAQAK
jgi:poly(3-hydroxybutyrate) depolymerase